MNRFLAIVVLCLSLPARAGGVVGGSQLLAADDVVTLAHWLGQDVVLTNIYTRAPGDIGVDFHTAADARGPTVSVMRALGGDGRWRIVGGYNPQSWDSSGTLHYTADPQDWSAFLFNLSDDVLWRQSGPVQTNNRPFDGPTFGAHPLGPDLGVTASLTQLVSWGGWSYGGSGNRNRSLVDGTLDAGNMELAALEVFSVAVVAEPAPAPLLAAGLATLTLLGAARRRQARGRLTANTTCGAS